VLSLLLFASCVRGGFGVEARAPELGTDLGRSEGGGDQRADRGAGGGEVAAGDLLRDLVGAGDLDLKGDASDDYKTAAPTSVTSGTGSLSPQDLGDCFALPVSVGQGLAVTVRGLAGQTFVDFGVTLFCAGTGPITSSSSPGPLTTGTWSSLTSNIHAVGPCGFCVSHTGGSGAYEVKTLITGVAARPASQQADMGTAGDASNVAGTPTSLQPGAGTGELYIADGASLGTDTLDSYGVSLAQGQTLTVTAQGPPYATLDLTLVKPDGAKLPVVAVGSTSPAVKAVTAGAGEAGVWRIEVSSFTFAGVYSLDVQRQ